MITSCMTIDAATDHHHTTQNLYVSRTSVVIHFTTQNARVLLIIRKGRVLTLAAETVHPVPGAPAPSTTASTHPVLVSIPSHNYSIGRENHFVVFRMIY